MNFVKPKYIIKAKNDLFILDTENWWLASNVIWNTIPNIGIGIHYLECVENLFINMDKYNIALNDVIKNVSKVYAVFNIINKIIILNDTDIICMEDEVDLFKMYNSDLRFDLLTYEEYVIKNLLE